MPTALPAHALIVDPIGAGTAGWSFRRDGKTTSIHAQGRVVVNVNEAVTAAAVAGLGIASTGIWGYRSELESGALVQILPEWAMESAEVNAIFAAGRAAKPSARAFVDFLSADLRKS